MHNEIFYGSVSYAPTSYIRVILVYDPGQIVLVQPSKPEGYFYERRASITARGDGEHAFARVDSSVVIGIVMPLRNFFSFLYYATAGMALNPLFMFHNFHIIFSFALLTSVLKAAVFSAALVASGAPRLSAVT